jgi:hypothetical protein
MPNAPKNKARAVQPEPFVAESSQPAGSSQLTGPPSLESSRVPAPPEPSEFWPDPSQSSQVRGSTLTDSSRPPESGSTPSERVAQAGAPPEDEESLGEDERRSSLKELESFIAQFRDRRITKTSALAGIVSIVVKLSISEIEKDQTIRLYTEELDSFRHGDEPTLPPRMEGRRPIVDRTRRRDHASIADNSVDGSHAGDSDDPDGPKKKRKLTAIDFPWYEPDNRSLLALPASCIETCKRLGTYLQDIPGCRNQIKVAPGAPRNVPISQWERIFRGETLDLDHFLSSLYRTTVDEEGETRIGNARISFGVTDAKRRVGSASEWASAWRLASKATSFVFPHRAEELSAYGDYIDEVFSSKLTSSHPRVIMFDIAVRNMVQGGQSCLLTDHNAFSRLHSAILMPDGAESTVRKGANRRSNLSSRAGGSKSSGNKSDICNRFNTSVGCPSSDSDCHYRHACKNCGKTGHGKEACTK